MSAPVEIQPASIKKLQIIGVDVAKQKLDVSIDGNTVLTIDNHEESVKTLLKTIAHNDRLVSQHQTGGSTVRRFGLDNGDDLCGLGSSDFK